MSVFSFELRFLPFSFSLVCIREHFSKRSPPSHTIYSHNIYYSLIVRPSRHICNMFLLPVGRCVFMYPCLSVVLTICLFLPAWQLFLLFTIHYFCFFVLTVCRTDVLKLCLSVFYLSVVLSECLFISCFADRLPDCPSVVLAVNFLVVYMSVRLSVSISYCLPLSCCFCPVVYLPVWLSHCLSVYCFYWCLLSDNLSACCSYC